MPVTGEGRSHSAHSVLAVVEIGQAMASHGHRHIRRNERRHHGDHAEFRKGGLFS
jgi:hypothetical protein